MELKLIVSGAPSGENVWGAQSDSAFVSSLYIPSKENQKFDIRLNKSGNTIYAYYHYLVYNTVNAFGGRTGSYFCLTIRLDSFCVDYKSIFNTLDTVFRKKIVGSILISEQGNRLQYSIPSFENVESELFEIEKYIRNTLGSCLSASDFKRIPSIPTGNGMVHMNSTEASSKEVMQAVGQYGACSISSEYVSNAVTQLLKDEFRQGAFSRQGEVRNLQEQISNLETEISHLREKLAKKNLNINTLDRTKVEGNPEQAEHEKDQRESQKTDRSNQKNLINTFVIFGALVAFLLAIISIFHYISSPDEETDSSECVEDNKDLASDSARETTTPALSEEVDNKTGTGQE